MPTCCWSDDNREVATMFLMRLLQVRSWAMSHTGAKAFCNQNFVALNNPCQEAWISQKSKLTRCWWLRSVSLNANQCTLVTLFLLGPRKQIQELPICTFFFFKYQDFQNILLMLFRPEPWFLSVWSPRYCYYPGKRRCMVKKRWEGSNIQPGHFWWKWPLANRSKFQPFSWN